VNRGNGALPGIHKQYWHAIGCLYNEENPGIPGHERIARGRASRRIQPVNACGRRVHALNSVRVNLPQGGHAHGASAQSGKKLFAIRMNPRARVPLGEAEIQHLLGSFPAVALRFERACAPRPRAESVNQPIEFSEHTRLQHLQATRPANRPGRTACGRRRRAFAREKATC
jgi:hypothetical protein